MPVNPYFKQYTNTRQQRMTENLIIESMKQFGMDIKYLPRTLVDQDFLLGEDRFSRFDLAVDIEVYVKSNQGFGGQGDFLSKFNLEINDQVTLTMSRRRWSQIATEKLLSESSYNIQLEDANTGVSANSVSIILESGGANNYTITSPRPMEGDLIYFPLNRKLYEIKFVEHEDVFYQFGKLYTYDLTCELYDRDTRLRTGNTAIDSIESAFSLDILLNRSLLEDGYGVLDEDGGNILVEFRLEDTSPGANNEVFTQEARDYIDFSEINPFSL